MAKPPSSDEVQPENSAHESGPGAHLRGLRMARNIDVGAVAAQLHLTPVMVHDLERDDYPALPGPVFVRGYIRSYARLLEIDPEPLIGAYNRSASRETQDQGTTLHAPSKTVRRRKESAFGATLIGFILVAAMAAGTWWWYQADTNPPLGSQLAESGEPMGQSVGLDGETSEEDFGSPEPAIRTLGRPLATVPDRTRTVALSEVTPLDPEETVATYDRTAGPEDAEPDVEDVPVAGHRAGAVDTDSPGSEPVAESPQLVPEESPARMVSAIDQPIQEGVGAPPLDNTAAVAIEGVDGQSTVVLAFVADSWVEIRDADSVRRLSGIMRADTEQVITGKSPFSLILGNSEGVHVTFNGEPVDHSSYARGNVARFELGEESSR